MNSADSANFSRFSHRLLRVADKLSSLGYITSVSSSSSLMTRDALYNDGYNQSDLLPPSSSASSSSAVVDDTAVTFVNQQCAALAFLEASAIRALPPTTTPKRSMDEAEHDTDNNNNKVVAGRDVAFELKLPLPSSSNTKLINTHAIISAFATSVLKPYFDRVVSTAALREGGLLPSPTVVERTRDGLSSESTSVLLLAAITAMDIIADVATALAVTEGGEGGGAEKASSSSPPSSSSAPSFPHPFLGATLKEGGGSGAIAGLYREFRMGQQLLASAAAAAAAKKKKAKEGEESSAVLVGAEDSSMTAADKKKLENAMLKLIGIFGLTAPPTNDATYLQQLTRMAARSVFLAQRILVCPKEGNTLAAAKGSLVHVPLFDSESSAASVRNAASGGDAQGGKGKGKEKGGDNNTKGGASDENAAAIPPDTLEQYVKALRLLLTLESELLQRFATMVVDSAQAYTAQCSFDPSGHRVGV